MTAHGAYEKFESIQRQISLLDDAVREEDPLRACQMIGNASKLIGDLAADMAEDAYLAGATKTAIAAALDVPVSYFRGMKKS